MDWREFKANHPYPGTDPIARLRHTVDLFPDQPDEELAVMATTNTYGAGIRTGLTWGDLRALADRLGA